MGWFPVPGLAGVLKSCSKITTRILRLGSRPHLTVICGQRHPPSPRPRPRPFSFSSLLSPSSDTSNLVSGYTPHPDAGGADSDVSSIAGSPPPDSIYYHNDDSPHTMNTSTGSLTSVWQQSQGQHQHQSSRPVARPRKEHQPDARYGTSPQQQTFHPPLPKQQHNPGRDPRDSGNDTNREHRYQQQQQTLCVDQIEPQAAGGRGSRGFPSEFHFMATADSSPASLLMPVYSTSSRESGRISSSGVVRAAGSSSPGTKAGTLRCGGGSGAAEAGASSSGSYTKSSWHRQQQRYILPRASLRGKSAPMQIYSDSGDAGGVDRAVSRARQSEERRAAAAAAAAAGSSSGGKVAMGRPNTSSPLAVPPPVRTATASTGELQHAVTPFVVGSMGHARSSSGGFLSSGSEADKKRSKFQGDGITIMPIVRTPRVVDPPTYRETNEMLSG